MTKKAISGIPILIFIVFFSACTEKKLTNPNELKNIQIIRKDDSGFFHGKFAQPEWVVTPAGELLLAGEIQFEKGKLTQCELAESQEARTPAGTLLLKGVLKFTNEKVVNCHLAEPQEVNSPSGKLKALSVSFLETGEIIGISSSKELFMQVDTPIGKLNSISADFFKSGKIRKVVLPEKQKITIPSGKVIEVSLIQFTEDGKIIERNPAAANRVSRKVTKACEYLVEQFMRRTVESKVRECEREYQRGDRKTRLWVDDIIERRNL